MKQSYLSLLFIVLVPFVFCIPTTHLEDELLSVLFSTRNSDTEFITLDDLYHVNHLTKDMDMEHLVNIFESADKNDDGKVYYEELIFFVKVDFAEFTRQLNNTFVSDSFKPIPQISDDAYPAVLIPGLTGTVLTNGGSTRYWMDTWQMLLGLYKTNLAVEWNGNAAVSKKSVTAIQGPNGVRSIGVDIMPYMNVLLDSLASSGVDAATYDWRMPPQSPYVDTWISNLKASVAGLKQAKNKKVFLIAHSLGNIMTLSLFNRSSEQQWVQDNIAGYIAVAPPFGGAGMPVEAILTGMAVKDPISFRIPADFIQKLPSIPLLAPYPEVFGDTVVLTHKGQSYTAGQFFKFLKDNVPAAAKSTVPMYENLVVPLGVDYLSAVPPVPVWLITCETEATVLGINYVSTSDYTQILESQQPYGDSIVPFISLHANDKKWQLVEGKTDIRIPGATHNNIVSNPTFIQTVQNILSTFQN